MRHFMAGFGLLGLLAVGAVAPASAGPLAVAPFVPNEAVQPVQWEGCGPRCQEYRREAREREWQHRRWIEHRHWEERHGWEEGRQYGPSPYANPYR